MASIANALSFHFLLLILLSLSLQPHARESKFFTKFTRYLSSAPTNILSPAPAPVLVPVIEPVLAPTPAPAPAPAEEDNGYGLYGRGSSDFSSEEFYTTNNGTPEKKESLGADEYKSESDTSFEKLLSGENYSNNNNGYSSNNGNGYSTSVNENNGYTNNNEMGYDGYNQNENGYMSSENKFNGDNQNTFTNNGNGYSNSINENNGYKADSYSQNNYNNEDNRYSSSMNQYNGYNNNNNEMSFENEKIGDNGNGYTNSEEENNGYNSNNRYVMGQQQGLSDTRFLENGKYSYDANNNGNDHETSYEEEVSDNGEGYYRNNEDSRYEFDSMGLQGKQRGLVKGGP